MNSHKNNREQTDNMELLKQQAADCGPGCGCHATGSSGKMRWVIGAVVLVAAGAMVVRAMIIKSDATPTQASATAFDATSVAPTPDPVANSVAVVPAAETSVGKSISAFAELNVAAANTDAVFIFLPGKNGVSGNPPSNPMNAAMRTMESKGVKCGLFTLKAGTRDYDQIAAQMSVPGVLAMVKGAGMGAVSGEITEAKLLQGYVAASSASGCAPSAGAGCCPKK